MQTSKREQHATKHTEKKLKQMSHFPKDPSLHLIMLRNIHKVSLRFPRASPWNIPNNRNKNFTKL